MKKILNIIGYFSLLVVPYFLIVFTLVFHDFVRIMSCVGIVMVIAVQVIHFRKTKLKFMGIRVLITIILLIIYNVLIYSGYGIVKNIEVQRIINKIEKIECENYEFSKEELEHNIKFINERYVIGKSKFNAKIYYKDGTTEETTLVFSGVFIIELNQNKYYINILK